MPISAFAGIFSLDSALMCRGRLPEYTAFSGICADVSTLSAKTRPPHHVDGRSQLQGFSGPGGRGKVTGSTRVGSIDGDFQRIPQHVCDGGRPYRTRVGGPPGFPWRGLRQGAPSRALTLRSRSPQTPPCRAGANRLDCHSACPTLLHPATSRCPHSTQRSPRRHCPPLNSYGGGIAEAFEGSFNSSAPRSSTGHWPNPSSRRR